MDISNLTDEEIIELAMPIWGEMSKASNNVDYKLFSSRFSGELKKLIQKEKFEKQCKEVPLLTSLGPAKPIACIRRDVGVTVLFRMLSTRLAGEFVGQIKLTGSIDNLKVADAQLY